MDDLYEKSGSKLKIASKYLFVIGSVFIIILGALEIFFAFGFYTDTRDLIIALTITMASVAFAIFLLYIICLFLTVIGEMHTSLDEVKAATNILAEIKGHEFYLKIKDDINLQHELQDSDKVIKTISKIIKG